MGGLGSFGAEPTTAAPLDATAKMLAEVRDIYNKYCPEKAGKDLDGIIATYAGREAVLLNKVRKKYLKDAATSDKENTPSQASTFGGMGFGSATTTTSAAFGTPNAKTAGFEGSPMTPVPAAKKEGGFAGMGGGGLGALSFGSGSLTSSVPSFGSPPASGSAFGYVFLTFYPLLFIYLLLLLRIKSDLLYHVMQSGPDERRFSLWVHHGKISNISTPHLLLLLLLLILTSPNPRFRASVRVLQAVPLVVVLPRRPQVPSVAGAVVLLSAPLPRPPEVRSAHRLRVHSVLRK
jgi:hypothetical protein